MTYNIYTSENFDIYLTYNMLVRNRFIMRSQVLIFPLVE